MPAYSKKQYWDERYSSCDSFDWYVVFEQLEPLLRPLLKDRNAAILILGCGNSRFSAQLYSAGYPNITNVDFSPVVIERMEAVHRDMEGMRWMVMDCTQLELPDASFDLAVDKGTTDAMLCGEGANRNVHQMFRHIQRLLKAGGHFVMVTYGKPDNRILHLRRRRLNWSVEHKTLPRLNPPSSSSSSGNSSSSSSVAGGSEYHVYIATKPDSRYCCIEEEEEDDSQDDQDLAEDEELALASAYCC
eukprot:RCo011979